MKGFFITFEGVEGSGKTTQIRMLEGWLKSKGYSVIVTREPGGTPIGDQIRSILLSPANNKMVATTEALLYAAARAQHIQELILPAIKGGKVVLSDRYSDATTAYQGAARNLDAGYIAELHRIATGGLRPDMTLLLDLPPEAGLKRAKKRNVEESLIDVEDRFEREDLNFHERVRKGYLDIARREPDRVKVINALKPPDEVHEEIKNLVEELLEHNVEGHNRT